MPNPRKAKRDQVVQLLLAGNIPAAADLAVNTSGVVTMLMQMLFEPESLLHWRATEAIGAVARLQPKRIKDIIPRLLWSLNEDSASFGWGAAAVLGEIGKNNYKIVEDIILMLFQFLEEDFTREGMLWGLGRLGQTRPEVVWEAAPRIQACLGDANPQVRAYAAWCLGVIGAQQAADELRRLHSDPHPVKLYDDGYLHTTTMGQVAQEALRRLEAAASIEN